jgi:hypothetical protein
MESQADPGSSTGWIGAAGWLFAVRIGVMAGRLRLYRAAEFG